MTRNIRGEKRAVSPVVGVALLIGMTVILATVIGSVVLTVGVGPTETPDVTLSFAVDDDEQVNVVHEGGPPLDPDDVVIRSENGSVYDLEKELATGERVPIVDGGGDRLDLNATDPGRLTVVWQDSGGDTEIVLGTFRP